MTEKYKDLILPLIKQNGPMGVNALSKAVDIPVSTLQKYLHRQSYFKLTDDKKWDLPENVAADIKSNTLELMTNVVENNIQLLRSQLEEMQLTLENTLTPIGTLKRGINNITTPVADKSNSTIDPRLSRIMLMSTEIKRVFNKQKANIPEEYDKLLFNFDYIGLVLKDGEFYTNTFLEGEIYELLAGKEQTLSDETVEILKENQISS